MSGDGQRTVRMVRPGPAAVCLPGTVQHRARNLSAATRAANDPSATIGFQSLEQLKLDNLQARREKLCLNFAKKSLQLVKFNQLFPINTNRMTRNSNKFLMKKYRTERAKKSSIPYMQTLLNKHFQKESQTYRSLVSSIFVDTCSSELQSESRLIADGNFIL